MNNSQQQQQQQQQPERQRLPQIYTIEQMEPILASERFALDLIDAVEAGFVAYSRGAFNAAPIQTLGAPPLAPFSDCENYAAQTCVKSGYITGDDTFCIKVASGGHPMPSNSGLLQVYSQATGQLETLLLDEGLLTEHRTAAAGAVAAKHMMLLLQHHDDAKSTSSIIKTIGILGTGVQARFQLRYLKHVTNCRTVLVWGRNQERAAQYQTDMQKEGWTVELASQPSDLWDTCDLIVTTTCAREPVLLASDKNKQQQRRRHITCIGADAPGKIELAVELVASAHLCVADSRLQTVERGEFQTAIAQGWVASERVMELGELIVAETKPEIPLNGLSIFDSSGVAVQDCAAAKLMSRLLEENKQ